MQEIPLTRSIFFADIAGSSKIYEKLGDEKAQRLIMELLSKLSDVARKFNGEFLRTYGDELMCAFKSADDAVTAAAGMHQIAEAFPPARTGKIEPVGLYIRIDLGTVIQVGNKIFGDAVNFTAKMKTLAKPFQTLISDTTLSHLSKHHKAMTRFVDKLPIKGKSGTHDIFEYLHEEEDATLIMERPDSRWTTKASLELTSNLTTHWVNENQASLTIGRLKVNDIVLQYQGVSRVHARIEHRKGKFILVDASSNGTYVHPAGRKPVYVKHDEFQLVGNGIICPASKATEKPPGAIHYTIHQ